MSDYLLDTNVLIAFANNTVDALPGRIRDVLADASVGHRVSVISPWEMSIKWAARKLKLNCMPEETGRLIADLGFELLPMTIEHALEVALPEPATKDPFDRLLLAVCVCEGLKLLTTDRQLAGHRLVY